MSVGFVGSSYQSVADINGSGAKLDLSLQSVLNKYDSITTDLDRLVNNATFNVYDVTSKQKYGDYNKDAQSGWAESWYSEYRAVLQMRADALKKKLSGSYNRVLEKSVYAEIKPDNTSVFAPYANRTASLTQVDYQTPISEILVKDVALGSVAVVNPPALPSIVDFNSIADYLNNPSVPLGASATAGAPTTPVPGTPPNKFTTPINVNTVDPATGKRLFSSISGLGQSQYEAFYNTISDSFRDSVPPIPDPPITNADKLRAKTLTDSIIAAHLAISTASATGGGTTYSMIDTTLAYARPTSIKQLLGSPIALPSAITPDISGYQPDAYYSIPAAGTAGSVFRKNDGTYTTWAAIIAIANPPTGITGPPPQNWPPISTTDVNYALWTNAGGLNLSFSGVYPNANTTGTAINTPNQPQNQNATLTGDGYLFNVDFSSSVASGMTIVGTNNTGAPATISSASVFSLNATSTNPQSATIYPAHTNYITPPPALTTADIIANNAIAAADFIPYGTNPVPVTTYYVDDLLPSTSSIADQICSTWKPLPPVGKAVAFKTRFPLDWYIVDPATGKADPRLGVKGGGLGSTAGTDFITYTGGVATVKADFIDRSASPSSSTGGLYYLLRTAAGLAPPTLPPSVTTPAPPTAPATSPITSYPNLAGPSVTYDGGGGNGSYQKPIGNAELTDSKNYNNPRVIVPQYGGAVISVDEIFKGMPSNVVDTMINNPDVMANLTDVVNSVVNSFVGRQYDDTVQGNFYAGQFDCSDSSPVIMISFPAGPTPPSALDIFAMPDIFLQGTSSLLFAGGGTPWGLIGSTSTPIFALAGIGPDVNYGHLSAVNDAGGFVVPIPTVGVFSMGLNVPIPIIIPPAINFTIWIGMRTQRTRDVAAEFIEKFLAAVKPLVVEALQTQAYSASGGTAFDTYASRGEYHFSNPGYLEAMKKLTFNIGPVEIPIGEMVMSFVKGGGLADLIGMGNSGWGAKAYGTDVNGANAGTRLFDYQQSIQGAENKETDAGAFFATQSFLSQFQMKNMESEYWIGTQQNEEVVNNDMLRALQTAGGQLMGMMTRTLAAAATAANTSMLAGAVIKVLVDAIEAMNAKASQEMWYKMLYGDINYNGSGLGQNGWVNGEGFDYIESDHKPFEGDSDFNYPEPPAKNLGTIIAGALGANADVFTSVKPPFIMDGYAGTLRFRKTTNTSAAIESVGIDALTPTDPTQANGYGARGRAGRTAGGAGFWEDTPIGDINEVYVGKRKVVFNNLDYGFGTFDQTLVNTTGSSISNTGLSNGTMINDITGATRETYAFADRYTGADTRAYGRRYDGANPINFESFNTGMYSDGSTTGSRYHYDRRNEYSLSFQTAASNSVINLQGSQALNPSIGGFIKLAEIDKNKSDEALLDYEGIDRNTASATYMMKTTSSNNITNLNGKTRGINEQKIGGSADGRLNEFNRILYEHMHLRADGRNLSEFNEYRDVFNMGFMKNFFVSGQSYHPSGGGVTSSLEIRYDAFSGTSGVQTNTRENYDANPNFDPYNTLTLNKSRGKASVYLNNYFAYKKRANKK